jgi:hypothetical protein
MQIKRLAFVVGLLVASIGYPVSAQETLPRLQPITPSCQMPSKKIMRIIQVKRLTPDQLERKGAVSKGIGIALASLSLAMAAGGIAMTVHYSSKLDNESDSGMGAITLLPGAFLLVGALGTGVASPFLIYRGQERIDAARQLRACPTLIVTPYGGFGAGLAARF